MGKEKFIERIFSKSPEKKEEKPLEKLTGMLMEPRTPYDWVALINALAGKIVFGGLSHGHSEINSKLTYKEFKKAAGRTMCMDPGKYGEIIEIVNLMESEYLNANKDKEGDK
ncbi:MAG: hypothetical protein CEN90_133 [Parcubacteria group bacterium Licking1014_17]|nr:MAG: hypothetical protein CEN90_133 [Parcubacteria group bacterium Licking1014_17]